MSYIHMILCGLLFFAFAVIVIEPSMGEVAYLSKNGGTTSYFEFGSVNFTITNEVIDGLYDLYLQDYPNETAACLEWIETDNGIFLYDYNRAFIIMQNEESVNFGCFGGTRVVMHSHPNFVCYPSYNDLYWHKSDYGIIVCGGEFPEDIIMYKSRYVKKS